MKLAFCLFNYFPFGGLQRDFMRIAKECVRRGHTVDVLTMKWKGEIDPDLTITVLPPSGWQNHTRAQGFVSAVETHCRQKQYDLVVGFNKMPGLNVYYAADTCYQAKARKQHGFLYRLLPRYRHLVHYEEAVFAPHTKTEILLISPLQQAEFMQYYGTPANRFHVLPPGITRDRIAPNNAEIIRQETRREFQLPESDYLLLLVGSGFKTKGLDRILTGVASLPETIKKHTHLFVIGQDNPSSFQAQAKQLGITNQVRFLGGRNDIPRFLLAADLLLHPAYNENTGTVLLEAVVAGLPVLTTDVCGYAHYIKEANAGVVLPSPYQQKQFNEMLLNMLSSPERDQWHENSIAFANKADIYSLVEHAVDVIEHCKKSE